MIPTIRSNLYMGFRPVGVYPNPISPTISHISSIIKYTNLYQPGGVSYASDTIQVEYEMIYLPYPPIISVLSILSYLSSIL